MALNVRLKASNFYPRPLRGGRLYKDCDMEYAEQISIHALCEEGDFPLLSAYLSGWWISIHALCEEGDRSGSWTFTASA